MSEHSKKPKQNSGFEEIMGKMDDEALYNVLKHRNDYIPEAVKVAIHEAVQRGVIPSEHELPPAETGQSSSDSKLFPEIDNPVIKNRIKKSIFRSFTIAGLLPAIWGIVRMNEGFEKEGLIILAFGIIWIGFSVRLMQQFSKKNVTILFGLSTISFLYMISLLIGLSHSGFLDWFILLSIYLLIFYALLFALRLQKKSLACVSALLLLLTFPISGTGQEEGRVSKTIETEEYTALSFKGAFGVHLIQGTSHAIEIWATGHDLIESLDITYKKGVLHLEVSRKPFDFSKITLNVTFKTLEQLRIFGGIRLDTRGYLDLDNLSILMEGGVKANLRVKANTIDLESKGGVLCELNGVANILNVRLAGTGHIDAAVLRTENVAINIVGLGTGKVYATETLHAHIIGAGKVKYRGNPVITQNIEGLGCVEQE